METKLFEIRDAGTFVPVLCTQMYSEDEDERYLLGRVGYSFDAMDTGRILILMTVLTSNFTKYDPEAWNDRTFTTAHAHIQACWNALVTGDVIDVEYILGEKPFRKISERYI